MAGDEGIVVALHGLGETGHAAELAQGVHQLSTAGENFVDIALVAHIKDQAVPPGVKHPVDGHCQLHRP